MIWAASAAASGLDELEGRGRTSCDSYRDVPLARPFPHRFPRDPDNFEARQLTAYPAGAQRVLPRDLIRISRDLLCPL